MKLLEIRRYVTSCNSCMRYCNMHVEIEANVPFESNHVVLVKRNKSCTNCGAMMDIDRSKYDSEHFYTTVIESTDNSWLKKCRKDVIQILFSSLKTDVETLACIREPLEDTRKGSMQRVVYLLESLFSLHCPRQYSCTKEGNCIKFVIGAPSVQRKLQWQYITGIPGLK